MAFNIDVHQKFPVERMLAQIYFATRKYRQCLEVYQRCLLRYKLQSKHYLGIAYVYFNLNKFEMAKLAFEKVRAMDPNNFKAHLGLCVVLYREQQY